jgi:hypothetical protein
MFPLSGRLARGHSICWRYTLKCSSLICDQQHTHCFIAALAGLVVGELVQRAAGNERLRDRMKGGSVANANGARQPNRDAPVNCVHDSQELPNGSKSDISLASLGQQITPPFFRRPPKARAYAPLEVIVSVQEC